MTKCPHCKCDQIILKGHYRQKLTRRYVQRFLCKSCLRKFGASTLSNTYRQKKPFFNHSIYLGLCSATSLSRIAKNLNISYSTVYHRFLWLSILAKSAHESFLKDLKEVDQVYLDEMESIEHTKLKPLTIPMIVNQKQQFLGVSVGRLAAKGHLAEFSRKKYGYRPSEGDQKMKELLSLVPENIKPQVVHTDGKLSYEKMIQEKWPGVTHQIHVRRSEKVKEEPHLKLHKKSFDPMFAINQRCAKLRADVNRLIRRSWCTTKRPENLLGHLMIYVCYNNSVKLF